MFRRAGWAPLAEDVAWVQLARTATTDDGERYIRYQKCLDHYVEDEVQDPLVDGMELLHHQDCSCYSDEAGPSETGSASPPKEARFRQRVGDADGFCGGQRKGGRRVFLDQVRSAPRCWDLQHTNKSETRLKINPYS